MLLAHAPQGYGSRSVWVCVCLSVYTCISVTKLTATYLVCESKVQSVLLGSLWHSKGICVNFSENALFASFQSICRPQI